MKTMKTAVYASNTEPKVGDIVRTSRHIEEGVDVEYVVKSVGLGRLGNKVGIDAIGENEGQWREVFYYCLVPQ